jgi:prevent-host-death family protein
MTRRIGQRELRNDNAEIIRQVMNGESFVVTRNGTPVADLVPHQAGDQTERPRRSLGELQAEFRTFPLVDAERWREDLRRADDVFGADDLSDPWAGKAEG